MKVRVERHGVITTVILNRPEVRNAVDAATAAALAQAFREFEANEAAHVAVLYGEHGVFCAGADLKARATGQPLHIAPVGQADGPMGFSRLLLSKPVIAAVAGYAVAGGLELALWCDLRVVEEEAVFGVFSRRWGVPLLDGGTVRLPRLIGLSRALDMLLTGRPVKADEALRIGLANRVVPLGTARAEAERLAREIARFPQICLRGDRQSAYQQDGLTLQAALASEYECGQEALRTEAMQGARRFTDGAGRHGSFDITEAN